MRDLNLEVGSCFAHISTSGTLTQVSPREIRRFPAAAAQKFGITGKKSVVYFFGADGSPSCTKEAAAFDGAGLGVPVIGVRSEEGVKAGFDTQYPGVKFVVDEGGALRKEIGIAADLFGLLGGRETYVLDAKGVVVAVYNDQFGPEKHVAVAEAALASMSPSAESGGFQFPKLF